MQSMATRLLYVATAAVLVTLLIQGADYYSTPYGERPRHDDYRSLRPAGSLGLLYGYIGAGMMVLMLTYSLRKRTKLLGKLFTLRNWLDLHIYLGIFGPLFIVLHTSFKVQGLVAVSFWSMVAVALSGYFGRYLYLQIPRNIQGDELSLKEIEQMKRLYADQLRKDYGLADENIHALDQIGQSGFSESMGPGRLLLEQLKHSVMERRRSHNQFRRQLQVLGVEGIKLKKLLWLIEMRSRLQQRIVVLAHVQRLFHYWHVIHKPFAIIMYIIMVVHIGVAIWTGYGWNF